MAVNNLVQASKSLRRRSHTYPGSLVGRGDILHQEKRNPLKIPNYYYYLHTAVGFVRVDVANG